MAILLLFSNKFIFNNTMLAWEIQPMADPPQGSYDAIIVLGGFSTYNQEFDRINFTSGSDRLMQGLRLLKQGVAPRLIISGGSGSITFADFKEGERTLTYLRKIGIPDSSVIIENESKNTHENATMTAKILQEKVKGKRYLLITSGFHMRRSLACFAKAGIECIPYSTDMHSGVGRFSLDYLFIPDVSTLNDWNMLFHEWFGCITYKAAGYI